MAHALVGFVYQAQPADIWLVKSLSCDYKM